MLFTQNHRSGASFSVLFKHKSLTFVNLSLLLHYNSIFWLEYLYIFPKSQRPALKVHVVWCKTGIYGWNLSEEVCLMYEDSFPTPLLYNLKYISVYFIHNNMKGSSISWSPSELAIFLKIYPRCFGQFSGSQDIEKTFCRRPCVSRLSFDSFDYGFSSLKALRQIWDILQGANSLRAKFTRKNLA